MKRRPGFTVIEIIVAIAILAVVGILGFSNIHDLRAHNRDNQSKLTVNAIYYQLQAFHKFNKYYPKELNTDVLPSLAPDLLKDPDGNAINSANSSLSYEAKDCSQDKCQSFTLTARLQKEADFVKSGN